MGDGWAGKSDLSWFSEKCWKGASCADTFSTDMMYISCRIIEGQSFSAVACSDMNVKVMVGPGKCNWCPLNETRWIGVSCTVQTSTDLTGASLSIV